MPTTQNQIDDETKAYAEAFNDEGPARTEMSEDDAFGLTPPAEDQPPEPEASEPNKDTEQPAVAVVVTPAAEQEAPAEDATEAGEEPAPAAEGVDLAKETQRLKSWEGRLKKMEADLKAAYAKAPAETPAQEVASDALEDVGEKAESTDNAELAQAAEDAAEKVESGEMSASDAMKMLAADFGEDFVKMIEVIAAAKAAEAGSKAAEGKFAEVGKTLDDVISSITDAKARDHFETIAEEHPDFNDIAKDPSFGEFLKGYPNGEKIAESGSARQINKMLTAFKAQAPKPAEDAPAPAPAATEDPAAAAAEGVRSTGMRLPEQPSAASSSYEDAWKDF